MARPRVRRAAGAARRRLPGAAPGLLRRGHPADGVRRRAAPQLARARLSAAEIPSAWAQLVDGLRSITAAGWAHGDLSAYNLLWWQGELWFIDFPQAVDIAANPGGLGFLQRDVVNVCGWFARHGIDDDPEAVFADLLSAAFG